MELPKALESVLGALLDNHSITSWKVTAEGQDPTVILRLRSTGVNQDGVSMSAYRRKSASQVLRDRRRMAGYRQRLEGGHICKPAPCFANGVEQNVTSNHIDSNPCDSSRVGGDSVNSVPVSGIAIVSGNVNSGHVQSEVKGDAESTRFPQDVCSSNDSEGTERKVDNGMGIRAAGEGEREGKSSNIGVTRKELPSLFPDIFPGSRSTHPRESVTQSPPLSPCPPYVRSGEVRSARSCEASGALRSPAPSPVRPAEERDARGGESEMETVASRSDGGMESDTGSDESTDTDGEHALSDIVRKVVESVEGSPYLTRKLRRDYKNRTFNKIVIDRQGRGVPRVLCRSDDVIVSCDTGTGEVDFHLITKNTLRLGPTGEIKFGDNRERWCREWPGVDRGGTYKQWIDEAEVALTKCMGRVRDSL